MSKKVDLIRKELMETLKGQREIATKYNVCISYVSRINTGAYAAVEGLDYPLRKNGYRASGEESQPGVFSITEGNKVSIFASKNPQKTFLNMPINGEFHLLENCNEQQFVETIKRHLTENTVAAGIFDVLGIAVLVMKDGVVVDILKTLKDFVELTEIPAYKLHEGVEVDGLTYIRFDSVI